MNSNKIPLKIIKNSYTDQKPKPKTNKNQTNKNYKKKKLPVEVTRDSGSSKLKEASRPPNSNGKKAL